MLTERDVIVTIESMLCYTELCVLLHKCWTLLTERDVIVSIDIYDQEGDKVHLNTMF